VADLEAAQWIVISALLDDKVTLFVVPRAEIPDSAIRRETLIDETKRSFALCLDDVLINEDCIMEEAKALKALEHVHLAELTGGCQSCIDYTVEYLGTRKQFGKLIGSFQALKHPTVDAFVDYQKARSLLYTAAYNFGEQGKGEIAIRMAKSKAEEAMSVAADRSIQFHGGFGFTYDCDAQLYRRRAIFHASQYGDARYHKQKLADLLLVYASESSDLTC